MTSRHYLAALRDTHRVQHPTPPTGDTHTNPDGEEPDMTTNDGHTIRTDNDHDRRVQAEETKASTKTTELYVYLAAVAAVVVTAFLVDQDPRGGWDPFGATDALTLITWLTIGYMLARGLAKSGSHTHNHH